MAATMGVAMAMTIALFLCGTAPMAHSWQQPVRQPVRQPWMAKTRRRSLNQSHLHLTASALTLPSDAASDAVSDAASELSSENTPSPNVGVLLLNLGGPETGADVEGFLYNLFADPDIIRLPGPLAPLQSLIAWIISKRRAPKSRAAYESIGGGSPILSYSNQQADLLRTSIQARYGIDVTTYIGMRYWHPFTEEALEQIRRDAIDALVILPLYPQFSISTSGSSLRLLQEEFAKSPPAKYQGMTHTVIPSWYKRPGYIKAMAALLKTELDAFTEDQIATATTDKPIHVLFSAHGVPASYIDAGDPYQKQIVECVDAIAAELKSSYEKTVDFHLSYQSRVGPIEWLRPYTDDVLPALGAQGVTNLVVVPISFVSEHIETLEEIDIEYRELAEESGVKHWRRCPALNTNPAFVEDLADCVVEALHEPAQTVTEACVANAVSDLIDDDSILRAGVQGVGGSGGSSGTMVFGTDFASGQRELEEQERTLSRIAMMGVGLILFVELLNGQSVVRMLSGN